MAVDYVASKELPILRCGMLIALSGQSIVSALEEIPSLVNMAKRGFNKDLEVKFLTLFGVKKLEPNLKSWGGIFIPEVAVINPTHFVGALSHDALDNGVNFNFNYCVVRVEVLGDSYLVHTVSGCVSGKVIINAAGLYADEVSEMAGVDG